MSLVRNLIGSLVGGGLGYLLYRYKTSPEQIAKQPSSANKFCDLAKALKRITESSRYKVAAMGVSRLSIGGGIVARVNETVTRVNNICNGTEPVPDSGIEAGIFKFATAMEKGDYVAALAALDAVQFSGLRGWYYR